MVVVSQCQQKGELFSHVQLSDRSELLGRFVLSQVLSGGLCRPPLKYKVHRDVFFPPYGGHGVQDEEQKIRLVSPPTKKTFLLLLKV